LKVVAEIAGQVEHELHQVAPDQLLIVVQGRNIHTASLS
jgi:hypothetical protein